MKDEEAAHDDEVGLVFLRVAGDAGVRFVVRAYGARWGAEAAVWICD
jgi:hypothetical protein